MAVYYTFQERPTAGQKQRIGSGDWEQMVNKQQRKLVRTYDQWAAGVKRDIMNKALQGQSVAQLSAFLDSQMPILEGQLIEVTNKGIIGAATAAAGTRANLPNIQRITSKQMRDNMLLVRENLVPNIHEKWTIAIAQGKSFDRKLMNELLRTTRVMPAQYSGGSWVAIFEVERGLGRQREVERAAQGLPAEKVRWVLDPRAEHCIASPGFFGCVDLAGEYANWDALPTVPAGQVTCRGNCRCHLESLRDGQWKRGVYDD
jgi:hypothetical protein